MARTGIRNVVASVHARLKQIRRPGDDFNLILQRYVAERFLYRLGASAAPYLPTQQETWEG